MNILTCKEIDEKFKSKKWFCAECAIHAVENYPINSQRDIVERADQELRDLLIGIGQYPESVKAAIIYAKMRVMATKNNFKLARAKYGELLLAMGEVQAKRKPTLPPRTAPVESIVDGMQAPTGLYEKLAAHNSPNFNPVYSVDKYVNIMLDYDQRFLSDSNMWPNLLSTQQRQTLRGYTPFDIFDQLCNSLRDGLLSQMKNRKQFWEAHTLRAILAVISIYSDLSPVQRHVTETVDNLLLYRDETKLRERFFNGLAHR